MSEVKFIKDRVLDNGGIHGRLFVNNQDTGMLYLSESEYTTLREAFIHGTNLTDIEFTEE